MSEHGPYRGKVVIATKFGLKGGGRVLRLTILVTPLEQAFTETMWQMVKLDAKKLKEAFDRA